MRADRNCEAHKALAAGVSAVLTAALLLGSPAMSLASPPESAETNSTGAAGQALGAASQVLRQFLPTVQAAPQPAAIVPPTPRESAPPRSSEFMQPTGAPREHHLPLASSDESNISVRHQAGRITLFVRDATLNDVLTRLAETQGLNIVTADSLATRLTITLDGVTLTDALDAILAAAGYTWVQKNNIIFVTNLAEGTTVAPDMQGREVAVIPLDFVSAADVNDVVSSMLSPVGQSFIMESSDSDNRRTCDTLVVEDLPEYLQRVRLHVAQLDMPPRQVLIEAHVLEVDLEDDTKHGINFQHFFEMFDQGIRLETTGMANAAAQQAFFVHMQGQNLIALLECLKSTTDAKTLASPRILAVNGQTARLQVGEQLGFRVTTTTETMTSESVEFLDVGVVLEVTPRISRDGRVLMRVKPEVSSGQVNPLTGLPEEETTELETDVMLCTDQGIVIGGLIQETDGELETKLPWLGELKHVGKLFKREETLRKRSEIIIALLPRVLPYDAGYQELETIDVMRTQTPLFCGPLERYPRPWEPRLPDTEHNPRTINLPPGVEARLPFRRLRCRACGLLQSHAEPEDPCSACGCEVDAVTPMMDRGVPTPAAPEVVDPPIPPVHTSLRGDSSTIRAPSLLQRLPPVESGPKGYDVPARATILR
jgi:type II secretory pathway component GspD/PulD (secretin)